MSLVELHMVYLSLPLLDKVCVSWHVWLLGLDFLPHSFPPPKKRKNEKKRKCYGVAYRHPRQWSCATLGPIWGGAGHPQPIRVVERLAQGRAGAREQVAHDHPHAPRAGTSHTEVAGGSQPLLFCFFLFLNNFNFLYFLRKILFLNRFKA